MALTTKARGSESALPKPGQLSATAIDRARDRAAAAPLRREFALALARSGQTEQARQVLADLMVCGPADAELLGLAGRINKDQAMQSADAGEARAHLQTALAFYLDGYSRHGDAYCGINAASLHAFLAEDEAAKALAAELVEGVYEGEAFWQQAIRAEASLLLGNLEEAKRHYAACAGSDPVRRGDLQSVWTQARRLCGFLHGNAALVDECFGGDETAPETSLLGAMRTLRRSLQADAAVSDEFDHAALRSLARELLHLQEEQRHALSRELHDNIAQLLSAATSRIALAHRNARSEKLRQDLGAARSSLETVIREVGELSRTLRPSLLDGAGLAAAIENHAAALRNRVDHDLEIRCQMSLDTPMDGDCATNLFRIVQEALHNIEKHAGATEVRIALCERDARITLEVEDNGCSFHEDCANEARRDGRFGLISMRQRAEMLGGTLEVLARAGSGTVVRAIVPIA